MKSASAYPIQSTGNPATSEMYRQDCLQTARDARNGTTVARSSAALELLPLLKAWWFRNCIHMSVGGFKARRGVSVMTARIVSARDGQIGFLGSIGVRFMIDGKEASGRCSLVEHPFSPQALAAPLHRPTQEDEYSFVLRV